MIRVLLIDDDEVIRRAVQRLLIRQRCAVDAIGPEHLTHQSWSPDAVRRWLDVVVTDLDLGPGMPRGTDVARMFVGLPVILHSGSLEQLAMQDRSLFAAIVQKPDARGLINAITEIAHRREAPNGAAV